MSIIFSTAAIFPLLLIQSDYPYVLSEYHVTCGISFTEQAIKISEAGYVKILRKADR